MTKRFWLSYDLGIDGDYDGLYAWLDGVGAVECGDSLCSFQLEAGRKEPPAAIKSALKASKVKLRPRDRLYLIWRRPNGTVTGKFVVGSRRRSPWAGYAVHSAEESEDAGE
jgi:hypothetical protein